MVGGRNRYRINGRQATPTQINEFFRSIHLNVNNPHFLILQGRITQVEIIFEGRRIFVCPFVGSKHEALRDTWNA